MGKHFIMFKKHYLFLLLVPVLIYIQFEILKSHLKFGFSDVDWGFLAFYHKSKLLFPNSLENFVNTFKVWGVYAHQSYYIGIMSDFLGLDFQSFQLVTNLFKILATIAAYPLFYIITKSRLAAILSVILFSFSYPAIGSMYTTVTSSDYTAVLSAVIFLWLYSVVVERKINSWIFNISMLMLFILTLFLSTERAYPLIALLLISEIFLLVKNRFSKAYLRVSLRRVFILFSPILVVLTIFPSMVFSFLSANGVNLIRSIQEGDLVQLLRPLLALGSIVVPSDLWKYFGVVKLANIGDYLTYFFQVPFVSFITVSIITGLIIFKKKFLFIIQSLVVIFTVAIFVFIFRIHIKNLLDLPMFSAALVGGYIFAFGLISFIHWLKYQQDERILRGIFIGIFSAFLFIILSWLGSDIYLNFSGVHRYLTFPALAICLALGSLFALLIRKLREGSSFVRVLSFVPFLVMLLIVIIWSFQTTNYFKEQLTHGFGAEDQQLMRKQLVMLTSDLNSKQPSLFYFDFSEDAERGYYYDNTLLGGFSTWMLWHPSINLNDQIKPSVFWNDFDHLKKLYIKEGEKGFKINEELYPLNRFYAFKLKDKRIIDIKEDLINKLND